MRYILASACRENQVPITDKHYTSEEDAAACEALDHAVPLAAVVAFVKTLGDRVAIVMVGKNGDVSTEIFGPEAAPLVGGLLVQNGHMMHLCGCKESNQSPAIGKAIRVTSNDIAFPDNYKLVCAVATYAACVMIHFSA